MSLEISSLKFSYSKNNVLDGVDLNVYKGEFVGILGPNGCGKSTLIKNILNIYKPNSGVIKIENKRLRDYTLKELSKIVGFVPQKSTIIMPLMVEDIILMGRYSTIKSSLSGYSSDDYMAVDEMMKLLNLWRFKGRVAQSLSGGEFQRVMLARALVSKPSVLLLDEPTSALDINYATSILKLCKSLVREKDITGVVVLHDLNLASLVCDRILLLNDGKIAYNGTTKKLFTKEILKEIYNMECEILYFDDRPIVVPL